MGQRITIQYTVEDHELNSETERLLSNALRRLTSISVGYPSSKHILSTGTLKEIDALRQELARIDIMLEDTSAIINGYIEYERAMLLSAAATTDMNNGIPESPDINVLQQKVEKLKQKIQNSDEITD